MAEEKKTVSEYVLALDNVHRWYKTGNAPDPTFDHSDDSAYVIPSETEKLIKLIPDNGATKRDIAYLLLDLEPGVEHCPEEILLAAANVPEDRLDSIVRMEFAMGLAVLDGMRLTTK